jgi:hypothetical protein
VYIRKMELIVKEKQRSSKDDLEGGTAKCSVLEVDYE